MAHPDYLKAKARKLRTEQGLTLDELVERLALPKTTIYYWVRDIPLPACTRQNPGQRLGSDAMQRKYRLLREAAYAQGEREFDQLAAEGYKRRRTTVSLGNSDPTVVVLAHHWISRFARNKLFYGLQYHADQDTGHLRQFWSRELHVLPERIYLQRKSNSGKLNGRTWRSRHGVMTVGSNDTLFRARLGAWMDCLRRQWTGLDSFPSGRGAAW